MRGALASGVLAILLGTASAVAAQGTAPPAPSAAQGDFAGLVDIGGRRLYLECQGTGSPTVVLEAGGSARGDYWTRDFQEPAGRRQMVLPAVAGFTRVCAYDRAGYGQSDPGPEPRDGAAIAADLDQALKAEHIAGPFVVVAPVPGCVLPREIV